MKESPRRVKPLLYVYRVLLTGIHLMRTGVAEANLVTLNEEIRLLHIGAQIWAGRSNRLQAAYESSTLPEAPDEVTRAALNDLLVRLRLGKAQ